MSRQDNIKLINLKWSLLQWLHFQSWTTDKREADMETNMQTTSKISSLLLLASTNWFRSYGFWISALNKADNYKRGKRGGEIRLILCRDSTEFSLFQSPLFQQWVPRRRNTIRFKVSQTTPTSLSSMLTNLLRKSLLQKINNWSNVSQFILWSVDIIPGHNNTL